MKRQCLGMFAAIALGACAGLPTGPPDFWDEPAESEIAAALRDALALGIERAATRLGQPDGYGGDERLRIPPPDMLERAARYLRATGNARAVAEFEQALNRAAEDAAPQAAAILADRARALRLDDARALLHGGDEAATRFLRQAAQEPLAEAFRPVIAQATTRVGVTRRYKQLVAKAGPLAEFLLRDARDLDAYVSARALDGLFLALAEEEARIRRDPAARAGERLARVFGYAARAGTMTSDSSAP